MGVQLKGKERPQWGKTSFILQGTFLSCHFSRKVPLPARSHRVLFGLKGNFSLVSAGFNWGPVPEHHLGADGPVGLKVVSVEVEKVQFLAGSNGCTPLKKPSTMHSASSHPQMNELIKLFFFALVYCVVQLSC